MKVDCPENLAKAKTTFQCMLQITNKCQVICYRTKMKQYEDSRPVPRVVAQSEIKFSFTLGCIRKVVIMLFALQNYVFHLLNIIVFVFLWHLRSSPNPVNCPASVPKGTL